MKKFLYLFFLTACYPLLINNFSLSQSGWFTQNSGTTDPLNSFYFTDANTGYVVGGTPSGSVILKTTNGGNNWFISYQSSTTAFLSVAFFNANTGYAVGGYYPVSVIMKTTNAGLSWTSQNSTLTAALYSVAVTDANTAYCCADWGQIIKTTNGGSVWFEVSSCTSDYLESIQFVNANTGYSVGRVGQIIKTTNAGANWNYLVNYGTWLNSVKFVSDSVGYAVGMNGNLLKTVNSGLTWNAQNSGTSTTLNEVTFIGQNNGFISSNNGTILNTTNGGINWVIQPTGVDSGLISVNFINSLTGFVCGLNGIILKTTTGGVPITFSISGTVRYTDNNQLVTSGVVKAIKLNQNDASIIVYDTAVIQSNGTYTLPNVPRDSVYIGLYPNSGTTPDFPISYYPATTDWQPATVLYPTENLSNINLGAIRMITTNANNSVNGKVLRLTYTVTGNLKDAVLYAKNGNTFVRCTTSDINGVYHLQSLPTGNLKIIVNRLGFTGDSTNVNVTSTCNVDSINFYLYRYPVGIRLISGVIPTEFKLYQNFPNPFNPTTKIKFDIPEGIKSKSLNIKLIVYDITGRVLGTLVNDKLQPGNYEVTFNGNNLPAGVYFYRLNTGDCIESKKLILLK